MNQTTNRRRRIIVNPELQKRIVFASAWPACLGMALALLVLGLLCSRLGLEALEVGVELPSLSWVFVAISALLVMTMGFVIWTSLRISHRVAGPTQNIRQVLERVRKGDLAVRVRLRQGDYLHGVADLINAHLKWLQDQPPVGVQDPEARAESAVEVAASTAWPDPS